MLEPQQILDKTMEDELENTMEEKWGDSKDRSTESGKETTEESNNDTDTTITEKENNNAHVAPCVYGISDKIK